MAPCASIRASNPCPARGRRIARAGRARRSGRTHARARARQARRAGRRGGDGAGRPRKRCGCKASPMRSRACARPCSTPRSVGGVRARLRMARRRRGAGRAAPLGRRAPAASPSAALRLAGLARARLAARGRLRRLHALLVVFDDVACRFLAELLVAIEGQADVVGRQIAALAAFMSSSSRVVVQEQSAARARISSMSLPLSSRARSTRSTGKWPSLASETTALSNS